MSRNVGEVNQVLIVDPSKALLVADSSITALTVGQIGIFSAARNVAIAGTPSAQEFFLSVGLRHNGSVATDAARTINIDPKMVKYAQFREYTPPQGQVYEITDFSPYADTEYQVKVKFRSAKSLYEEGGRVTNKAYSVVTSCSEDCTSCKNGNCIDLAVKLAREIAADPDNLYTVKLFPTSDKTTVVGTIDASAEIDPSDQVAIDAYIEANTEDGVITDCLSIRLYQNLGECSKYCGFPEVVYGGVESSFPETPFISSLTGSLGFEDCNAANFTLARNFSAEEVSFNDAELMDIYAQGWESGPYRQTESGVYLNSNRKVGYRPDCIGYHSFYISFDIKTSNGWMTSENMPNTIILLIPALPGAASAGIIALLTALDSLIGTSTVDEYSAADVATPALESVGVTPPIDDDSDDPMLLVAP
jgi:hypothetical protein